MSRYLYNIEVQKTKYDFEISLFKKGSQQPVFLIAYKKFNACVRYVFVKNKITKNNNPVYELISCYYYPGKSGNHMSTINKRSRNKYKIVRIIKNSKNLHDEFKKTIKEITSGFSRFKYKKIGNLRIYSTNETKIFRVFNSAYDNLHKIR